MSSISLSELEDSIRDTLILSAEADIDPNAQLKLIDIFRKIRLSRLLDEQEFVSIGGTQGAGKTTFLETLYKSQKIDEWLKGNIGRGEQTPVLILEKDIKQPKAQRIVFNPKTKKTETVDSTKEEFREAVQDWNYTDKEGRHTLLNYLYIPKVHNLNFGWMLLPGYEPEKPSNATWQGVMRYALLHASGMIFVTDETRMAQSQTNILKDIKAVAKKVSPIIAISRGESIRNDKEKTQELINRASELYEVKTSQIILAGTDFENWENRFAEILQNNLRNGRTTQEDKLEAILEIVQSELRDIISEVETIIADNGHKETQVDRKVDSILEKFDEAVKDYREDLASNLDDEINQVIAKAIKSAEHNYDDEETGFINNVKIGLKHITFNTNEIDKKRQQRIQISLQEARPLEANMEAIKKTSSNVMKINIGKPDAKNLLGYGNSSNENEFTEEWQGVGNALR